jgi:putative CocE/NonD family hydrolase
MKSKNESKTQLGTLVRQTTRKLKGINNSFNQTFFILICCLAAVLHAQNGQYLSTHYTKQEVYIPMRDGVRLFTAIYMPKDTAQKYPIILQRTPYSIGPYGVDRMPEWMSPSMLEAHEGYIFVNQDVRGRFMSEGEFVDIRPYLPVKKNKKDIDESSDTYDTVAWLLQNLRNHNGRVGVTGISYPGFYASMATIDAHPAVVATSPQAPCTDWFLGDDEHHHGAFFLSENFNFYVSFGYPRPQPTTKWRNWSRHGTPDGYDFFLEMGPLANANKLYLRDSVAYWNLLMQHGTYDEVWQARSVLPHLKNIKPVVMTVGGWFDKENLFGALKTYKHIESNNPNTFNILVMGPWSHGQWDSDDGERLGDIQFGSKTAEWFRQNVQLPFFNSYLKDKGTPKLAEAIVFETGANQWRMLDRWPPQNVAARNLYLQANGKLAFTPPESGQGQSYTEYLSDPNKPVPHSATISISIRKEYMIEDQRFAARRPDVLVFETGILEEDVVVAGPIVASLYVSTTGTDADWVAKMIDVFPDTMTPTESTTAPLGGYQMLVRAEVMRGKFRNSYSHPEPFVPNEITKVEFELQDVFHRFKKGHKIMVQIQSSWFPLVDRNPQKFVDIYSSQASDFQKAMHRVYHSPQYGSRLKVLVQQ